MYDFLTLIERLEAITKQQVPQIPYAAPVDPTISTRLQLDRRLFNPKNW
jgi:hypothetical protein